MSDFLAESPIVENKLFVYGSMCEGMVHFKRISDFVVNKQPARVVGSVFRLEVGYPVIIMDGQDIIEGQQLELNATDTFWRLMDEFHGFSPKAPEKGLHHRLTTQVFIGDKSEGTVQVYAMNSVRMPKSAVRIEGGDWKKSLQEREPMIGNLTVNQRTYIQKLGRSAGRDIVPINLDLYRELMNKGLIVDKGRRLALTQLGQEVFRYLE